MELDAIAGIMVRRLARHQTGGHRAAMLGPAAAGIVLVQIVGQCVPAATDAHHDVRAQDLQMEDGEWE